MPFEKQELHCHECNKYVQFDIDPDMDGDYIIPCPNCGHEHCRVVDNGTVTDERWGHRNGFITIFSATVSNISIMNYSITSTSAGIDYFLADSWCNTTTSS